jgi:hypothetical protein
MTEKAIDLESFRALNTDEQAILLHRDGIYVGKRSLKGHVAVLYQLHGFYAEIWYAQYRRHIDRILASESTDILQPYLDQVQVRDLDVPPGG